MKLSIASLTILCLALAAVPAFADYSNGAINGTTDAWTINFGYVVSDTFITFSNDTAVTGFMVGVWEFPGDSMTHVDWSITSGENSGTVYGSGTAITTDSYISANQYGYNIDKITVSGLNVAVQSNASYWLNLQNASVASGNPVYWDENSGVGGGGSSASESAVGTIPSEAFTVNISRGYPTPEPYSILLFGIVGVAGLVRRKLF